MLISEAQQKANRENAKHSTGPQTPAGKARASLNALTHGLRSRCLITPDEDVNEYLAFWDRMEAEWQPQSPTEYCHFENMVAAQWMLARADWSENRVKQTVEFGDKQFAYLNLADRRRATHERSFRQAMETLGKLQKNRKPQPAASPDPEPQALPPAHPRPVEPPLPYLMAESAPDRPAPGASFAAGAAARTVDLL